MTPTDDAKDQTPKDQGRQEPESSAAEEDQASAQADQEAAGSAAEPGPADEAREQQAAEGATEERRPLDVYAVLRVSIMQLSGVAWQMMGLQADPFTNKMGKDTEQARVAIDATAALVEKLLPHIEGQEAKDYQSLLTDLRLNFVTQSGEEKKEG